jgi:hypothetical protein
MDMTSAARAQAGKPSVMDDLLPLAVEGIERVGDEEPPLILALDDLVRDTNGEVVLFNDSGLRALAVSTDAAVVGEGRATRHKTAAGEDVSGFRFIAFDNGLKLFYQPDLELLLVRDDPRAGWGCPCGDSPSRFVGTHGWPETAIPANAETALPAAADEAAFINYRLMTLQLIL